MSLLVRFLLLSSLFYSSHVWSSTVEIFPGQSFKAAVESLQAGDTLIVHSGTYSESGSRIRISAQGSASSPIMIKGAEGEPRPLISRPDDSTPQNIINIEGAAYVTISNLEITGNGDGIHLSGQPHHITLEDNEIHDIDVGINFRSSMEYIVVRRNHIHHTDGTAEGLYVGCNYAQCAVSNSIIENNWIHDLYGSQGDGIEIKYGSWGNLIRYNIIHDTKNPCILAYGVTKVHVNSPNVIERNIVWNCQQSIDVIADTIVRDNIVIGSLETQSHVQVPVMRNVSIINNTVIGDMPLLGWDDGTKNLTVSNNLIIGGSISYTRSDFLYSSGMGILKGLFPWITNSPRIR